MRKASEGSVQADPSLCWAHVIFCWFCHAAAQMCMRTSEFNKGYDHSISVQPLSHVHLIIILFL